MYGKSIDQKWQKHWQETKLYEFDETRIGDKFYCLEMFSYPSGANLHLGHWYNYGLSDVYARFKRMQGYNVFQPMGYDAFGLPAENFAIKTGIHPKDSTEKSITTMTKQLHEMGATFNWEYTLETNNESYYKWTQWLFLKLYCNGLAYRKNAPSNWCPDCKTVLANEQVVGGKCERCNADVYKKNLTQWFFKIIDYADELIDSIDSLDWPERTKKVQKNWIGRSYGTSIDFKIDGTDDTISVFTTRADTLMGATYLVVAPEHPIVKSITKNEHYQEVDAYIKASSYHSEIERQSTDRQKTGVFTGAYTIHPLTSERLPIWIADYVLASYGTGCVIAVPAHDTRDYEFATKYNLSIKKVIDAGSNSLPVCEYGTLINSGEFNSLSSKDAISAITKKLEEINAGKKTKSYRLHDWLVSRQRYWGAPIPIVYCDRCGTVPIPEEDLPVHLPYDVVFEPSGVSPLQSCDEFLSTKCPKCGKPAKRETDTLDTFVCSSWYYLRYVDPKNIDAPFDPVRISKMLPVDKYVGGPEHATMHLLYARFITKALRDMGYIYVDEPFKSLTHQGDILGSDGKRMSKSRPEFAITPDEYTEKYGSDVLRLYLAFGFSYVDGGKWDDNGFHAIVRFVSRIERLIERFSAIDKVYCNNDSIDDELEYTKHNTIKSITYGTERFQFNTSVARLMELTNVLEKIIGTDISYNQIRDAIEDYLRLLAPYAPHLAEELWQKIGNSYSIFNESWPKHDENKLQRENIEMVVQINGRIRAKINVPTNSDKKFIEDIIFSNERIQKLLQNIPIKKIIVIPNKIVNIVV